MSSFIQQVVSEIIEAKKDLQRTVFILPTKRAIVFFKRALAESLDQPIISPEIFSIEEFVENISGLKTIDNTRLLFEFYQVYKNNTSPEDQEPFERFISWAPVILQDFNEIDRYLVDPKSVLNYLTAIKDLEHWSLSDSPSPMIQSHLKFWDQLYTYYLELTKELLSHDLSYQGLTYRKAIDQLEIYMSNNSGKQHVFMGLNALNKAETIIIQEMLQNDLASIYWDTDQAFINEHEHSAGLFMRQYQSDWPYFRTHPFNWINNTYEEPKHITISGVPNLVGQAKYAGQVLRQLISAGKDPSKIALVLGDENLLLPVLNSIPQEIRHVNITMGLPLKYVPLSTLFEFLFKLHRKQQSGFYYKDVLKLISHPSVQLLLNSDAVLNAIHKENKVYISLDWLQSKDPSNSDLLALLFSSWQQNSSIALKACHQLIFVLRDHYKSHSLNHKIDLEYLFRMHTLFNSLTELNEQFQHFNSIDALFKVYRELLGSESLDFRGEPLEGLQIMGMLESRALDFETLIITSVNEGILPGGKTHTSFLPYDVKLQYQLPTYKEKDAVYTYHFYRLLQRASEVHLIYNTEIDTLKGGEMSRFIHQLEVENIHPIHHQVLSPSLIIEEFTLKTIQKTKAIEAQLFELARSGFSPSALTAYIRNPLDYYLKYILSVDEMDTVEEHIAANTLGTVLHESLELLYKPLIQKMLTPQALESMIAEIAPVVEHGFKKYYGNDNYNSGKNLIAFEVAKRYLYNFIQQEKRLLASGHKIKILALEHKASVPIGISGVDEPINLRGTVDRIDEFDGILRIIDYKTGKVSSNELIVINNWDELITEYSRSKAFQLLCYAYIYWKSEAISLPIKAGIVSFKNLKPGVLPFGTRSKPRGPVDTTITEEILLKFEVLASQLILEILDVKEAFTEKEIK